MAETLHLPYSVQGNGTVESIGNHLYRVCGPAGCTVVMGLSNALYLSRNVPTTGTQPPLTSMTKKSPQPWSESSIRSNPHHPAQAPDLDALAR